MDRFGGLNCSSDLNTTEGNHSRAQRLFEQTVSVNQEVLNRVKERETRSNNVAQLFRDHYNSLLSDAFLLEGQLKEMTAQSKSKTKILRELQLHSAYAKYDSQNVASPNAEGVDEAAHRKLLEQLKETITVRDALIDEIHVLQKKNQNTVKDRSALLELVSEKERTLFPLEKSADSVAQGVNSWKSARTPCQNLEKIRDAIEQFISWTVEEELAFRRTMSVMSKWNTSNDESMGKALHIHDVDTAVRFYQQWNDALANILSHVTHKFMERHQLLQSRIDKAQNDLNNK